MGITYTFDMDVIIKLTVEHIIGKLYHQSELKNIK